MTNKSRLGMRALLAALTVSIAATLMPAAASAQQARICGPRDTIAAGLAKQFQEQQDAIGLAANGNVLEIYVSRSGSWTILMSTVDGRACILGTGEAWQGSLAVYDPQV